MIPQEIIRKKRDNKILSSEEIQFFVNGLNNKNFSDQQIASMSMAIFLNGMSEEETVMLTNAMTRSGDILDWKHKIDNDLVCDKHSTGGVGDKVSIILAPILAACGVYVPMISGRGLGHTGGTLDKFESIPGYNIKPDIEKFYEVVKKVGCAIIGQTSNLVPADKKLYSIRDVVGTVESIPLITSSILSKKIAAGLNSLVLDVKIGNGSFNSNENHGKKLAKSLVKVAKGAGLKCSAVLTDMNQVLGFNVGHTLEIIESIDYLTNKKKNNRLELITNELISVLLMMIKNIDKDKSINQINEVIQTGKAAEKFENMVATLGGPNNILSSFEDEISKAPYREDIFSTESGYVQNIETRDLGIILIELGGGRKTTTDKIDFSVGFESVVSIGTKVDSSKPLMTVHARTKEGIESLKIKIRECFKIGETNPSNLKTIYETII
tara:strand:- start:802 stop:2115 length:1314 start_codon:yes stop_codon:yes gene_type:complete